MLPASDILTLSEAARLVRVSPKTLGELARTRRVPAQKVGREWRFLRSALEAWLGSQDSLRSGPSHGPGSVAERDVQYEIRFAGFGDTAFSENHKRRLHRWVPWVAGFSSSFVAGVLDNVKRNGEPLMVLDPFAGVGTTLVEAIQSGDNAIGFEINPYAALVCKVKARTAHYDVSRLSSAIERFNDYGDEKLWRNTPPSSIPPPAFRSRVPFFSPDIEPQVLACLDFMHEETSGWVREFFQLALGSVMVSFSNYSYEPSLGTRAAAGKPNVEQADVPGILERKLWDIHDDIVHFQSDTVQGEDSSNATVHQLSYMEHAGRVAPQSVDVVITSPPYLNNYHYIRNTRPQLFWLGLVSETSELKTIERKSFGQFWQTVRSGPEIALIPHLPHLADQIHELRGRYADKGPYGGPGWANYAASYFNDCLRFCQATKPLMRPGGPVVVVIGNSILQGMEFQTDKLFAEIAELEGFEVVGLHEVRTKRTGNSVVNSSVRAATVSKPTRLYETAVELRSW
jgi:excisionase family DNA binding protein